mgnify:CR=1 FL=1
MAKILVNKTEITILEIDEKDYISLTDMVKGIENGLALIEKWLRNKNTIEFLGIWEEIYNPNFNSPEFEGIKNMAGLNRFIMSVKQWIEIITISILMLSEKILFLKNSHLIKQVQFMQTKLMC